MLARDDFVADFAPHDRYREFARISLQCRSG